MIGNIPQGVAQELYADLQSAQQVWNTPYLYVQIQHHAYQVDGNYQQTQQVQIHLAPNKFCYNYPAKQIEIQGDQKHQFLIQHQDKSIYISPMQTKNFRSIHQPDSLFQQFEKTMLVEQNRFKRVYEVTLKNQPTDQLRYHIQILPDDQLRLQMIEQTQVYAQGKIKTKTEFTYEPRQEVSCSFDALTDVVFIKGQFKGKRKYKSYTITWSSYAK